jgi:transposase-like protein
MNKPPPGAPRGIYREGLKKVPATSGPNYHEALARIRTFVRDYWISNGYSPAVDEIARECGYHRASVYYWVHRMREKGDLLFDDKVARSFRLPGQTVNFPEDTNL